MPVYPAPEQVYSSNELEYSGGSSAYTGSTYKYSEPGLNYNHVTTEYADQTFNIGYRKADVGYRSADWRYDGSASYETHIITASISASGSTSVTLQMTNFIGGSATGSSSTSTGIQSTQFIGSSLSATGSTLTAIIEEALLSAGISASSSLSATIFQKHHLIGESLSSTGSTLTAIIEEALIAASLTGSATVSCVIKIKLPNSNVTLSPSLYHDVTLVPTAIIPLSSNFVRILGKKLLSNQSGLLLIAGPNQNNKSLNGVNSIVEPFKIGAADNIGIGKLHDSKISNLHSFFQSEYGIEGHEPIEVPLTDISSFIKGKRTVDLLRMDVEGYEVEVINGLEKAIKNGSWTGGILFECHYPTYDDATHSMRAPLRMLFKHGYQAKYLTSSDENKPRIRNLGYQPVALVQTNDTRYRGIYRDISNKDTEMLICNTGGVRDAMMVKT